MDNWLFTSSLTMSRAQAVRGSSAGTLRSTALLHGTRFLAGFLLLLASSGIFAEDSNVPADPRAFDVSPRVEVPHACCRQEDALWFLSTRSITSEPACVDLNNPNIRVLKLDRCGFRQPASWGEYWEQHPRGMRVIYVHGNRMNAEETLKRALFVYRQIIKYRSADQPPVHWTIWSWPSEKEGILLRDFRVKAQRADAQSLYLGWLLRESIQQGHRPKLIGFSFGARVTTGALHCLAGGAVVGRRLPGETIQHSDLSLGLLAPAIGEDWLRTGGRHGLATRNLKHLTVLYNESDAVLRRYPLLDRGSAALGYNGPRGFAPRTDGRRLDVVSKNCSSALGRRHIEEEYYRHPCLAGHAISQMLMVP